MTTIENSNMVMNWLSLTQIQMNIDHELETILQERHQLSLKEFYVLFFLFEAPDKKLRLVQLQNMVGLSQSAVSRLVSRFEAKGCGALQRYVCDDDRRGVYTSLTKAGEEKLQKALVTFKQVLTAAVSEKEVQDSLEDFLLEIKK